MTKRASDRTGALLRLLQVLLVVGGLVAMHQMGGGPHRMSAMDEPGPTTTASTTPKAPSAAGTAAGRPTGAEHVAVMGLVASPPVDVSPESVPADRAGVDTAPGTTAGPGHRTSTAVALVLAATHTLHPGTAALCLAVLLGVLAAPTLRSTGAPGPRALPRPVPARHDSAPLGRGPPRLLLARLCVLRT